MNVFKDLKYDMIPTFDECVKALGRRFDDAEAAIERLQEENNALRSEHYKDGQLQEMANYVNEIAERIGDQMGYYTQHTLSINDADENLLEEIFKYLKENEIYYRCSTSRRMCRLSVW